MSSFRERRLLEEIKEIGALIGYNGHKVEKEVMQIASQYLRINSLINIRTLAKASWYVILRREKMLNGDLVKKISNYGDYNSMTWLTLAQTIELRIFTSLKKRRS